MSMNEFGPDHDKSATDAEGVLFASQPIWERNNRKRRGLGGRKATSAPAPETVAAPEPVTPAEPRSFAADDDMILDRPVGARPSATAAGVTAGSMTADEAPLAAPIGRPSTRADHQPRSRGTGPAMIATGAVALVALAAGGFYLSRSHDTGVPTLTPGATTSEVAAAPLPPVDLPPTARAQMANPAANPPPSARAEAPAPTRMARAAPTQRIPARARPAAASAGETGVNASASATLPDAPQPYSKLNPSSAPTQVNPPPAPAEAAPATPIPQTPPTQAPQQATPPADTTPPDTTPPSPSA